MKNPVDCLNTSKYRCLSQFRSHLPQPSWKPGWCVAGHSRGCSVIPVQMAWGCLLGTRAGRCYRLLQQPNGVVRSVLDLVIGKNLRLYLSGLLKFYFFWWDTLNFTNAPVAEQLKGRTWFSYSTWVWQNARKESLPPRFRVNDNNIGWKPGHLFWMLIPKGLFA